MHLAQNRFPNLNPLQNNTKSLDLVIMKSFPPHKTLSLACRLFNGSIHQSRYVETIKCKKATIYKKGLEAQVDGETAFFEDKIEIEILPSALKVVVPNQ